jgi:L-fuculose-phosphate aldolase
MKVRRPVSDTPRSLVRICHRLAAEGYVVATDGNVSFRKRDGNIVTTRSGVRKESVKARDLVTLAPTGGVKPGHGKPSTEIGMHLFVYRERPDVHAVVHAHPLHATAFAAARLALDQPLLPEVIVTIGRVPLAAYATPSTPEVARSLVPFVHETDAILLTNHGVVTFGTTLEEAFQRMERVEHVARVTFLARMLGGEKPLTKSELKRLCAVSERSYGMRIRENVGAGQGKGRKQSRRS